MGNFSLRFFGLSTQFLELQIIRFHELNHIQLLGRPSNHPTDQTSISRRDGSTHCFLEKTNVPRKWPTNDPLKFWTILRGNESSNPTINFQGGPSVENLKTSSVSVSSIQEFHFLVRWLTSSSIILLQKSSRSVQFFCISPSSLFAYAVFTETRTFKREE